MKASPPDPGVALCAVDPGRVYSDVEAYYSARVAKYGAKPLGVDWSCQATQNLRFVQLLKVCDFSAPFTLNDIGCGYGALCAYLTMRHPDAGIDYLGIDLSRAMISRARRRYAKPGRRFAIGRTASRVADYSVASGIMNVNVGYGRAQWEDFVAIMLGDMRHVSRLGFSVNFVTMEASCDGDLSNPSEASLYCTRPDRWVHHCERELDCVVEVVENYGMKEFTLLVRCR